MKFPYAGWVLMPSFKPKEITFVRQYETRWGTKKPTYHQPESGKEYHVDDIYKSKTDAIRVGHKRLNEQQEALDKKQLNLNKRRAVLEKAAE